MSRPRTIDQDKVLSAAEAVVGRYGAANLTLDAVATEAGISKASVVYDYGSKQYLIKAVIERRLKMEEDRIRAVVDGFKTEPSAEIKGRIAAMSGAKVSCEDDAASAWNLCSALGQDQDLRGCMQQFYRGQLDAILSDAENPRKAIIAFLALEGLKTAEYFELHSWSEDERNSILSDVESLLDTKLVS
jgi:AcrR family transcriptional regulator